MSATLNGQPLTRNMTATAGVWTFDTPGRLTVLGPNKQPHLWRLNGKGSVTTQPGVKYTASWTKAMPDDPGYAEITAQAPIDTKPDEPKPPRQRNAVLGLCIGHQRAERNALDEEGLRLTRFASMVSSDWLRPDAFSLNFDSEIDAARWHRQHMPAGSHLNVRGPNLWSSRRWSSLDIADWQAWANAAVDSGFAALVDSFAGPNEPNGSEYSGDPDRDTTAGRARINAGWNAAAKILRERTGKPVATPSYTTLGPALEALTQCTNCNAVDAHPYQWSEAELKTFAERAGDRLVMFTEWATQTKLANETEQANANRRRLAVIRPYADLACWYVWRIPRPKDDAGHGWMAAYTIDGRPRGAMQTFAVRMMKPVTVHNCVWSNTGPGPSIAGTKRIVGVPPTATAAQVAQNRKLIGPGELLYVDHFVPAPATIEERNARLAPLLPAIAATGPVILYDTIGRYNLSGIPGTETAQQQTNDATMRTLGQHLYGVGISLYAFSTTTPAYATADVREAVRISGGKPVVGFVSPHWAGRVTDGLVPMDTFRAYVRAAIDAGASEIVVWAHVGAGNPAELTSYVQAALDEATR